MQNKPKKKLKTRNRRKNAQKLDLGNRRREERRDLEQRLWFMDLFALYERAYKDSAKSLENTDVNIEMLAVQLGGCDAIVGNSIKGERDFAKELAKRGLLVQEDGAKISIRKLFSV